MTETRKSITILVENSSAKLKLNKTRDTIKDNSKILKLEKTKMQMIEKGEDTLHITGNANWFFKIHEFI